MILSVTFVDVRKHRELFCCFPKYTCQRYKHTNIHKTFFRLIFSVEIYTFLVNYKVISYTCNNKRVKYSNETTKHNTKPAKSANEVTKDFIKGMKEISKRDEN